MIKSDYKNWVELGKNYIEPSFRPIKLDTTPNKDKAVFGRDLSMAKLNMAEKI